MCIFWSVLALFYLGLAIATFVSSRPIQKDFASLAEEGPDLYLTLKNSKEVSLNRNLHRAYKAIIITDVIGFILAAAASIISAFFV